MVALMVVNKEGFIKMVFIKGQMASYVENT